MHRFLFSLLGLGICLQCPITSAADDAAKVMPDYVQTVLKWFPADTETLIVASRCDDPSKTEKTRFLRRFARQPIIKPIDDFVDKQHVLWAVHGGRNFDVISAFGTVRQEGVSVIRLSEPLAPERIQEIKQTLRKEATETLQIAEHEVFAFPPLKQDAKSKPWESKRVILLDDSTIIKASSAPYLDEFFDRMQSKVTDRALPDDLPEWMHVDFDAEAWLLRHVPAQSSRRKRIALQGLVWTIKAGRLKLVYVPVENHSVQRVARMPWVDQETNKIPELLQPLLNFATADDGTVTFSYRHGKPGADDEEFAKQIKAIQDSPELTTKFVVFSMFYMNSTQGIVH